MKTITVVKSMLAGVLLIAGVSSAQAGVANHFQCVKDKSQILVAQTSSGVLVATVNNQLAFKKVSEEPTVSKGVHYTFEHFEGIDNPLRMHILSQDESGVPKIVVQITAPNGDMIQDTCYRFGTIKI